MKKIVGIINMLCIAILLYSCAEESVGQTPVDNMPPQNVTGVQVQNTPGGALLTYTLPDDEDLLYVKATFILNNGQRSEVKSSVYTNILELQGFGDTNERLVTLVSVDRSQNESEPLEVKVQPLEAPIFGVQKELKLEAAFGGINVTYNNPTESNIVINIDVMNEKNEYVSLEKIYTKAKNGVRKIRGMAAEDTKFRYYSPEMGIYISSDPIGLAGGFNTYAYVKDTNTWVDVLGLSGELVYQLIRDNKVVYYGITSRTALERMAEHGKTKVFDNMEILADGLTHDQARSIEGALIRQRLKERADDWSDFDSIKARLDKSGLDNRNRGRIKERWTSENPLDDLRDKIYKKPKKVKVGCKS